MQARQTNRVGDGGITLTWPENQDRAGRRLADVLDMLSTRRTVFVVSSPREAIECLALAVTSNFDFGILDAGRYTEDIEDRFAVDSISVYRDGHLQDRGASYTRSGRISVVTSGTTDLPKVIDHTWESLNTLARARESSERTWFVPYQAGSYAWYQMMCLGLFSAGQHLECADPARPVESFIESLPRGITAVSSTPTFWRYALLNADHAALSASRIDTITLGGEVVDQAILDELRKLFPRAGLRHIYASSEAGAAIVVSDGHAGFPVERLASPGDAIELRVEDSKLQVRSPYTTAAAMGRPRDWVDTGDLVEVRDGRVHFLGRESGVINVGGSKVLPADVEARLLQDPNVLWASVRARKAPIVGEIPAARVVLKRPTPDPAQDEARLVTLLSSSLPEHAIPRLWTFLNEVPITPSQKSRA